MKKTLFFLILLINYAFGQNWIDVTEKYIVNPDFEDTVYCPNSLGQVNACIGWYQPTMATSDYYNVCNNFINGFVGIPNNLGLGQQLSFSGQAFLGFYVYAIVNGSNMWSEYVQTSISNPLVKDEYYLFSMRVVRGDGFNFSCSKIGAHFSAENMQNYSTTAPYILNPTVLNTNGFINDTINWTLISGVFQAKGDEKFLTIGWFGGDTITDDASFLIPPVVDSISGEELYITDTYYAVDSLKLYKLDEFEISIELPNTVTLNQDGINDLYFYKNPYISNFEYTIVNRWGNIIYTSQGDQIIWNGKDSTGENIHDGVYFLLCNYTSIFGEKYKTSQFIQVIN